MTDPSLDPTPAPEAVETPFAVDEPQIKLVLFELSGRPFAVHGERIREVLAEAEVFFVPGCPPSLEGIINVRGDIESVIHLHGMLGLEPPGPGPSHILLARASAAAGGLHSGLRIDRLVDVTDLPQGHIHAPPATLSDELRPYIAGVIEQDGRAIPLLDLDRLLTDYARGLG